MFFIGQLLRILLTHEDVNCFGVQRSYGANLLKKKSKFESLPFSNVDTRKKNTQLSLALNRQKAISIKLSFTPSLI